MIPDAEYTERIKSYSQLEELVKIIAAGLAALTTDGSCEQEKEKYLSNVWIR